MATPTTDEIYALAEPQYGYFTSAQATIHGLNHRSIATMARRGSIERVSRGVYRIVHYPVSQLSQYMEAVLWPQRGVRGVISHQSALAFHGLSDVSPNKIHMTVSPEFRVRRNPPEHISLHSAQLEPSDFEVLDGIPVTTPVRSILDCHATHLSRALIRQAIDDGRRHGKLLASDVARIKRLISDDEMTSSTTMSGNST